MFARGTLSWAGLVKGIAAEGDGKCKSFPEQSVMNHVASSSETISKLYVEIYIKMSLIIILIFMNVRTIAVELNLSPQQQLNVLLQAQG